MWPLTTEGCYVSIDIEADGPIPGVHSMLSLGAAAFDSEENPQSTWSANLEQLPEATEHPRGMVAFPAVSRSNRQRARHQACGSASADEAG